MKKVPSEFKNNEVLSPKARSSSVNEKTEKLLKNDNSLFENIDEANFMAKADTGDILLFRTNRSISKMARGITNSHFDHVAMVLKFENLPGEVYLIEATANTGVALNRWTFLRAYVGDG